MTLQERDRIVEKGNKYTYSADSLRELVEYFITKYGNNIRFDTKRRDFKSTKELHIIIGLKNEESILDKDGKII